MKSLLTPNSMYSLEKAHFTTGTSSLDAMENAAISFVDELIRFSGTLENKSIFIVCGSGNNGGDGYAIARLAHLRGAKITLFPAAPLHTLNGDTRINAERAIHELQIPCLHPGAPLPDSAPDIWVDALFGIGLNRPLSDCFKQLIDRINSDRTKGSVVASVDIPSGLNAKTGRIESFSVFADLTVTFQHAKTGHYLLDGMDACGEIRIRDIGMKSHAPNQVVHLIEPHDPACVFAHRPHNCHKGAFGHLLVVAGSFGMTGAAMYTAHAALRCGAGLVTIACPESILPILQTLLPSAMCISLPERYGAISSDAVPILTDALRGKSAVVIGPGLSQKADPSIIRAVLECNLPTVVDADALNLIAAHPDMKELLRPHHILTPHPGEARRLLKDFSGDPLEDAVHLRNLNATVLLKGAASVICGKETYISASGSPAMATGGSGDVLAGVIGALLAAGINPETAAWAGSEVHGRCGELACDKLNAVSVIASDLIDQLPAAISELYR